MKKVIVLMAVLVVAAPVLAADPQIATYQRIGGPTKEFNVSHNRLDVFYDNTVNFTSYYWVPNGGEYADDITFDNTLPSPYAVSDVEFLYGDPSGFATQVTVNFYNDDPPFTFIGDGTDVPYDGFIGTLPPAGWWQVAYTLSTPITVTDNDGDGYASIMCGFVYDGYGADGPGPYLMSPPVVGWHTYYSGDPALDKGVFWWWPVGGTPGWWWFGQTGPSGDFGIKMASEFGGFGCKGDFNCDKIIDFQDIDPFVTVLGGGACCDGNGYNCDVNSDGSIDFGDIDPFVELLSSGATCP